MCFLRYNVVGRCVSCTTMWWADVFHALQCGGQMCFLHCNAVGRCVFLHHSVVLGQMCFLHCIVVPGQVLQ